MGMPIWHFLRTPPAAAAGGQFPVWYRTAVHTERRYQMRPGFPLPGRWGHGKDYKHMTAKITAAVM